MTLSASTRGSCSSILSKSSKHKVSFHVWPNEISIDEAMVNDKEVVRSNEMDFVSIYEVMIYDKLVTPDGSNISSYPICHNRTLVTIEQWLCDICLT